MKWAPVFGCKNDANMYKLRHYMKANSKIAYGPRFMM